MVVDIFIFAALEFIQGKLRKRPLVVKLKSATLTSIRGNYKIQRNLTSECCSSYCCSWQKSCSHPFPWLTSTRLELRHQSTPSTTKQALGFKETLSRVLAKFKHNTMSTKLSEVIFQKQSKYKRQNGWAKIDLMHDDVTRPEGSMGVAVTLKSKMAASSASSWGNGKIIVSFDLCESSNKPPEPPLDGPAKSEYLSALLPFKFAVSEKYDAILDS